MANKEGLNLTKYWQTTLNERLGGAEGPLPAQVDVAVIGAGITGLSAARELGRRGASAAVLEANTIGWGASSRNGGMVLTGMKLGMETILQRFGRETAQRWFQAGLDSINCVEKIVQEERMDCDFNRSGHLELAYKAAHFKAYQRAAELMESEFQHPVQILDRATLQDEIASQVYYGGMLDPQSAGLNPARYVMGLGKAAQRAGAYLFENAAVKGLEKSRGGFRLDTARGALQAREVIVATSGYTGAATPVFQQRIVPIGSYIIATETLPSELAEPLSPQRRMMFDSKNYLFYFRLTADRRMLFGGRASFVPETPASVRRSAELLQKGMTWVYPQLAQVSIQYVWGGNLDFALDWLPHAGSLDGVHYALGYAGHGVALATLLGTRLGEKLAGGEDHNPFKDLYFPRLPAGLHAVIPPLMPLAGWWFRFLDWVS